MMDWGLPMPALLMRILGSPHLRRSWSAAELIEDGSVTSHLKYVRFESAVLFSQA
jgi:hypothetical protein